MVLGMVSGVLRNSLRLLWTWTWLISQLVLQFRAEIDSSVFVCNTQAIVSVSVFSVLTTITCGWLFKLSSNQLAN